MISSLWKMPNKPEPGEKHWVRNALALPRSWRGFVAAFDTREEAEDAWSPGYFVRETTDQGTQP